MAGPKKLHFKEIYIPRQRTDMLGFGIIHCSDSYYNFHYAIGTQKEIMATLTTLDKSGISADRLKARVENAPHYWLRTGDIVAMTLDWIRLSDTPLIKVPAPSENMLGLCTEPRGRTAFRMCLEKHVATTKGIHGPRTEQILIACQELAKDGNDWEVQDFLSTPWPPKVETCDEAEKRFREVGSFLCTMECFPIYSKLLGHHIRLAMFRQDGETGL